MPYAQEYHKKFDLRKAQDDGDKVSATELCIELENIASSLNQNIAFMRAITTADMKIQPNQILGTTFVIEDEQTATASQTEIFYANSVTVDPLTATVGVFINGDRLPASQTTVQTASVLVTPALTAGDNIMLEIHDNADSVFSVLASILNAQGASLVGIEDIAGIYASSNVEDALAEAKQSLNDFITAVGDLTKYLKADVAIPLEIDQDAAGFTWKNLKAAVDPNDPVILQQINDVLAILTNLENTFLPLVGGIMSGPINMGDNSIVSLAAPVGDTDAARKKYVDDLIAAVRSEKLSVIGNKDTTATATITGPVFLLATDDADVAEADQTTDPAAILQPTWNETPRPAAPRQVANKIYVDDAIVASLSNVQFRNGVLLDPDTGTQTVAGVTITKIGTGQHRIIVPAGILSFKLAGNGGGAGGRGSNALGGVGGKTYYLINAGSDKDLGLGGNGLAGGAVGGAAAYGVAGGPGEAGDSSDKSARGGSGGPSGSGLGQGGAGCVQIDTDANGTSGGIALGLGAGGGGGGNATSPTGFDGGGGGGYGEAFEDLVESDIIDIFTGAGGVGGAGGGFDQPGGDATFGSFEVRW